MERNKAAIVINDASCRIISINSENKQTTKIFRNKTTNSNTERKRKMPNLLRALKTETTIFFIQNKSLFT